MNSIYKMNPSQSIGKTFTVVLVGASLFMAGCAHLGRGPVEIPDYPCPEISSTGKVEVAVQYAASTDPHTGFNTLEVYFQNRTLKPVEFKSVSVDGRTWPVVVARKIPSAIKSLSVGGQEFSLAPPVLAQDPDVTWWQFYPTAKAAAGETVVLQVNFKDASRIGRMLEVVDAEGKRVSIPVPRFLPPQTRITAITYPLDYSRVYVQYKSGAAKPQKLWLNNMPVSSFKVLESAVAGAPSMLAVKAPFKITTGMPLHVKLQFNNGDERHCLVRALNGISLDAPVAGKMGKIDPSTMGFDVCPPVEVSGYDVACSDTTRHSKGGCAQAVTGERSGAFARHKDRLLGVAFCTAVYPELWNIYGQVADAVYSKSYRLGWSKNPHRFIEEEEKCATDTWLSAQPRPFLWVPDRFKTQGRRYMEPDELQVLAWTMLMRGAKGIRYHFWKDDVQQAFVESPGLPQGIAILDRQITTNRPTLSPLVLETERVIGEEGKGWIKVYTAWAGERGMLLMVRNLNYRCDPENRSGQGGFVVQAKEHLPVDVALPNWIEPGITKDFLTGEPVLTVRTGAGLRVELDRLGAFRMVWIENKQK
jgi:hypothetical protein